MRRFVLMLVGAVAAVATMAFSYSPAQAASATLPGIQLAADGNEMFWHNRGGDRHWGRHGRNRHHSWRHNDWDDDRRWRRQHRRHFGPNVYFNFAPRYHRPRQCYYGWDGRLYCNR